MRPLKEHERPVFWGVSCLIGGVAGGAALLPRYTDMSSTISLLLIGLLSGGVVLLSRSVGRRAGVGVGVVTGLTGAIVLAVNSQTPAGNTLLFAAIAGAVLGLLGLVAARSEAGLPVPTPQPDNWPLRLRAFSAELGNLLKQDTLTQAALSPGPGDFDQFVREALHRRFSALGIRTYTLSADGEKLLPCGAAVDQLGELPSARDPVVAACLADGNVRISRGRQPRTMTAPESVDASAWLLPLSAPAALPAIIRVRGFEHGLIPPLWVAEIVRDQLRLLWTAVLGLRRLELSEQTDRQSGVLNRMEFLTALHRVALQSDEQHEPLVLVALAIEGLRGLDDRGRWATRDRVIESIGDILRSRVGRGDLIGRFADDRFIVVFRRMESGLGRRMAEQLISSVEQRVFQAMEDVLAETPLEIRAGVASTGIALFAGRRPFPTFTESESNLPRIDPDRLMARAAGLVEHARAVDQPIVTDESTGIPEHLLRQESV